MKKWIALLLALICLLSLCACGQEEVNTEENQEETGTTATSSTGKTEEPDVPEDETEYITVYLPKKIAYYDGAYKANTYNNNGNLIKEAKYDKYGDESRRYNYSYDGNGKLIKEVYYSSGEKMECNTYTYDEKGNEVEHINERFDGGYSCHVSSFAYTYNENGNITEETFYRDGEKSHSMSYDEKGNQTAYVWCENGEEVRRTTTTYTYDEKGNITEMVSCVSVEESWRYTYVYDEKGNVTETATYSNGVEITRDTYVYDEKGNVTESVHYYYWIDLDSGMGSLTHSYTYTYAYTCDENGNITQCNVYRDGYIDESESYTCTYIAIKLTPEQAEKLGYI